MTSLPCMLVVLYSCINWCEIDFMWSILLMRTCFCVVSYSRCGLSGQERESVDSEKDEAGRSFGSAGTSAGGDGTGLLSPDHYKHTFTRSQMHKHLLRPAGALQRIRRHERERLLLWFSRQETLAISFDVTFSWFWACLVPLTRIRGPCSGCRHVDGRKNAFRAISKTYFHLAVHSRVWISVSLQWIISLVSIDIVIMIALTVTVIMIIIYYSCIVIINYCFVLLFQDPHVAFFTNSKPKFFPWNASSGLKQMGGRVCVKSVTAGFSLSSRNVPERSDLLCLHISLDIPYEPGHSVRSLSFCFERTSDVSLAQMSISVLGDHLGKKKHCLDTGLETSLNFILSF